MTSKQATRWQLFNSQADINQATTQRILDAAKEAIAKYGTFLIVLAGGSTPKSVYEQLAKADADWSKWYIYYNDDRCLPVDHPERNSLMAAKAWLDHVAIPKSQIFDIPTELGPIEGAK